MIRGDVIVERMTEADVADVLATAGQADGGRLDAAQLGEELARPWARLWVARGDDTRRAVAFLVAWHVADELHVLDVATHPASRRRGYGRALMEQALAYSREHGIRHVLLEVRVSNAPAIRLYRGCGFFAMGVRKRYYADEEDALEMALVFDERGEVENRKDEVSV